MVGSLELPNHVPRPHNKERSMKRKIIEPGSSIEVRFRADERDLIRAETFMSLEYMDRLQQVVGKPEQLVGQFTLDDIEDLVGDIAAAANHTEDRKVERRLDSVFERLSKLFRSFDDGNWSDSEAN